MQYLFSSCKKCCLTRNYFVKGRPLPSSPTSKDFIIKNGQKGISVKGWIMDFLNNLLRDSKSVDLDACNEVLVSGYDCLSKDLMEEWSPLVCFQEILSLCYLFIVGLLVEGEKKEIVFLLSKLQAKKVCRVAWVKR